MLVIKSALINLSHDDVTLAIAVINGIFGVWIAFLTKRNKKDIDGVAAVVGTERARARKEKRKND